MQKAPGIAEAIDWLAALELLGVERSTRGRSTARSARCSSTPRTRTSSARRASRARRGRRGAERPRVRVETVGLDLPAVAGAFGRRLHDAGVPVTPDRAARFAQALTAVRPETRRRLYWTARATLVTDATQVRAFDAVFAEVFGTGDHDTVRPVPEDARSIPAQPDHRTVEDRRVDRAGSAFPQRGVSPAGSRAPGEGEPEDDARDLAVPALASDEELLRSKRFDALDPSELARLYHLMSRLEMATPTRRTGAPITTAAASTSTCGARCAGACARRATRSASRTADGASSAAGS